MTRGMTRDEEFWTRGWCAAVIANSDISNANFYADAGLKALKKRFGEIDSRCTCTMIDGVMEIDTNCPNHGGEEGLRCLKNACAQA